MYRRKGPWRAGREGNGSKNKSSELWPPVNGRTDTVTIFISEKIHRTHSSVDWLDVQNNFIQCFSSPDTSPSVPDGFNEMQRSSLTRLVPSWTFNHVFISIFCLFYRTRLIGRRTLERSVHRNPWRSLAFVVTVVVSPLERYIRLFFERRSAASVSARRYYRDERPLWSWHAQYLLVLSARSSA